MVTLTLPYPILVVTRAERTLTNSSAHVQFAILPQRWVSARVAKLALDQAARVRDRLQVAQRAAALEADLPSQRNAAVTPTPARKGHSRSATVMRTCVASPSSLKQPSRSVPINARPSAAEAVGDVPCRLHAYKQHKSALSACMPWPRAATVLPAGLSAASPVRRKS